VNATLIDPTLESMEMRIGVRQGKFLFRDHVLRFEAQEHMTLDLLDNHYCEYTRSAGCELAV
jgi:hypothetical protein